MFDKWFYIHLGKMCGPVTADELNELAETGGLDAKDLIWRVEASPKDAVRAGGHLIFFLAGGTPTPPASPGAPAAAPDWLSDLADVAEETADPPSASPLDWLQDVRNAEQPSKPREKK
jgi:GYF domain 2